LKNLPEEQEGIIIKDYILLANPYPIFPEHLTISNLKHRDQSIKDSFGDLLFFSRILSEYYTIFYNGPQCGASAPDHLHFQAGSKNVMPLDSEFDFLKNKYGEIVSKINNYTVLAINDRLRRIISIEGDDESTIRNIFDLFYNEYSSEPNTVEPLMNIICSYNEDTGWRINIMLRDRHRPEEYFLEGEERVIFSPAACDYGGLCITPMEKDFNRFNGALLNKVFGETSISEIKFRILKERLKAKLK
jgi:galactose-1-phosphate uridylyltransferase